MQPKGLINRIASDVRNFDAEHALLILNYAAAEGLQIVIAFSQSGQCDCVE